MVITTINVSSFRFFSVIWFNRENNNVCIKLKSLLKFCWMSRKRNSKLPYRYTASYFGFIRRYVTYSCHIKYCIKITIIMNNSVSLYHFRNIFGKMHAIPFTVFHYFLVIFRFNESSSGDSRRNIGYVYA